MHLKWLRKGPLAWVWCNVGLKLLTLHIFALLTGKARRWSIDICYSWLVGGIWMVIIFNTLPYFSCKVEIFCVSLPLASTMNMVLRYHLVSFSLVVEKTHMPWWRSTGSPAQDCQSRLCTPQESIHKILTNLPTCTKKLQFFWGICILHDPILTA